MNAVKFLKERQRMFEMAGGNGYENRVTCHGVDCARCAFYIKEKSFCLDDLQDYEGMEAKLEEWIAKHPKRTYQQDFLEKYPNAPLGRNGVPNICPYEVGYFPADLKLCAIDSFVGCVECWGKEME